MHASIPQPSLDEKLLFNDNFYDLFLLIRMISVYTSRR